MRRQGHKAFVGELARFAARGADRRLTAIAERAAAPLRVAVLGRRGVGCSVVARALNHTAIASGISARAGLSCLRHHRSGQAGGLRAIDGIAAARRPVLAVLNKADVAGFAGDGPIVLARARCLQFAELFRLEGLARVPVEPMIGLLAVAAHDGLDDASWAALRMLAAPAGFGDPAASLSTDLFAGSLRRVHGSE